MVTATTGTATFRGVNTKTNYSVSFYIADVVATRVKWNQQGTAAATSPDYVQFSEPVVWFDTSILTGPTVTTSLVPTSGGAQIVGKMLSIGNNLDSKPTRIMSAVQYKAGSLIGAVEA